jgi:hypothetical protein
MKSLGKRLSIRIALAGAAVIGPPLVYISVTRHQQQAELNGQLWSASLRLDVQRVRSLLSAGADPNASVPQGSVVGDHVTHGTRLEQWIRNALHMPPAKHHFPASMFEAISNQLTYIYQEDLHIRIVDHKDPTEARTNVASCKAVLALMASSGGQVRVIAESD